MVERDLESGSRNFEILHGGPDFDLSDEDARELSESLLKGVMGQSWEDLSMREEYMIEQIQVLKDFSKNEDTVFLKADDKIVGICGLNVTNYSLNNKGLVTIRALTVLPYYRGRNGFSLLWDDVNATLASKYPTEKFIHMVHTRNEKVKEKAVSSGTTEVDYEVFNSALGQTMSASELKRWQDNNWSVFCSEEIERPMPKTSFLDKAVGKIRAKFHELDMPDTE